MSIDFFGDIKVGIIDSEPTGKKGEDQQIMVKTRHPLYNNSESIEIEKLGKIEDDKITTDEFIADLRHWLLQERAETNDYKRAKAHYYLGVILDVRDGFIFFKPGPADGLFHKPVQK